MRNASICVVLAAMLLSSGAARAQVLIYSYETTNASGPDGFFGLGATVTQDTIGATHGSHSMKYDIGVGGFVGARTETVIPPELNDPPGVVSVLFDVTLTAPYTDTFANVGITLFGHALNAPGGAQFGNQVQFADEEPLAGLGVGTHLDRQINLNLSVGPYRPGESFNDIFGPGPLDLTVSSAFQFYVNKNVLSPLTIYIDNVRLVVPEPATIWLIGLGALALVRRRK